MTVFVMQTIGYMNSTDVQHPKDIGKNLIAEHGVLVSLKENLKKSEKSEITNEYVQNLYVLIDQAIKLWEESMKNYEAYFEYRPS